MDNRTKLVVAAVAAVATIAIGAGVGVAAGGDDDKPLRGADYDQATSAALEHVGEGTVVETEKGDGGPAYEVEVRLDDGRQVEVDLDGDFDVIGTEHDDDPDDSDEGAEDH